MEGAGCLNLGYGLRRVVVFLGRSQEACFGKPRIQDGGGRDGGWKGFPTLS